MRMWVIYVIAGVLFFGCNSGNNSTTTLPTNTPTHLENDDIRAYQHGIDFLKRRDGSYLLIWASSGLPPQGADAQGEWTHDVYYSVIQPNAPRIEPQILIDEVRAQEPVSATMTTNGHVMVSMEDAFADDEVYAQTYGVYDAQMQPLKGYRQIGAYGGHSGHVSAVGDTFVLFYSEGWVEGGGVNELGSGDDVWLQTYDADGIKMEEYAVAVGTATRDWWPLVAGSKEVALLLWQQFVPDEIFATLRYSIYNPKLKRWIKAPATLLEEIQYYHYDVQYLEAPDAFLVCGTAQDNRGFALLLSTTGEVLARQMHLPPLVREAQPALQMLSSTEVEAVYPTVPSGVAVLVVSRDAIDLKEHIAHDYRWNYSGTDGIFTESDRLYFINLSAQGLEEIVIDLK